GACCGGCPGAVPPGRCGGAPGGRAPGSFFCRGSGSAGAPAPAGGACAMMIGWSATPGCAAIAKAPCESQMVETVPSKIALVAFIAASSPDEEYRRPWRPAFHA